MTATAASAEGADDPRAEFVRREHPRLVGTLSLYCGDRDLAHELAQEALARACRDWRKLAEMAAPGAYVHRIAINLANSWFRRRAVERRVTARVHDAEAVHHDADAGDAVAVRRAVAALPRRQRAAVVLRYWLDLPVAEVAEAMGCAEGTVKALTFKGIANLRAALADAPEEVGRAT